MRTQNRTDLRFQNTAQIAAGLTFTARTNRLTVLHDVINPVENEGVNLKPAIIGWRNFDHFGLKRQDTILEPHDLVQHWHFEADARLNPNLFDLAKTQHQYLFTFVHNKDRRQHRHGGNYHNRDQKTCFPHQFDPPLRRNSFSGR